MFPYPYVLRTDQIYIYIYPKICSDREADPFDFEPKPTIGFESKTKDRGHEPDPTMDPRVEDKKMCVLFTDLCSKQIPVWKHLKKLFTHGKS